MTPQIFPGLKPPTSKLFCDLQDFIDENGGMQRLADRLESEMAYAVRMRYRAAGYFPKTKWRMWKAIEDQFILDKNRSVAEVSDLTGRTKGAIYRRMWILRKTGVLPPTNFKKLHRLRRVYLKNNARVWDC